MGCKPLDRVMFQFPNCNEVVYAIVACLKALYSRLHAGRASRARDRLSRTAFAGAAAYCQAATTPDSTIWPLRAICRSGLSLRFIAQTQGEPSGRAIIRRTRQIGEAYQKRGASSTNSPRPVSSRVLPAFGRHHRGAQDHSAFPQCEPTHHAGDGGFLRLSLAAGSSIPCR